MLRSKYVDLENIRKRKDLGYHLFQSSHITDEVTRAQKRDVKFPKDTVTV